MKPHNMNFLKMAGIVLFFVSVLGSMTAVTLTSGKVSQDNFPKYVSLNSRSFQTSTIAPGAKANQKISVVEPREPVAKVDEAPENKSTNAPSTTESQATTTSTGSLGVHPTTSTADSENSGDLRSGGTSVGSSGNTGNSKIVWLNSGDSGAGGNDSNASSSP
ncbi:MAG: hypothetical protein HKL80_06515 [Acidimicrobiales bacterium]|nr:hypothetical protein [Acidimicrobiales bacterium]